MSPVILYSVTGFLLLLVVALELYSRQKATKQPTILPLSLLASIDGRFIIVIGHHMTTAAATQAVNYTAVAADKFGNPATEANPITWTSSDATIATIASSGAMTGAVTLTGKLGTVTITATDGTNTATDTLTVTAGPAASLTINATVA